MVFQERSERLAETELFKIEVVGGDGGVGTEPGGVGAEDGGDGGF